MAKSKHELFAAMDCSSPVTWTKDIKGMFTATDVAHMKAAKHFDLSSYNDVKVWAVPIYEAVSGGFMPPPGSGESAWAPAKVSTFACWIKQGCPQ